MKLRGQHEENLESLQRNGYFIVENVLNEKELNVIRTKMDAVWKKQLNRYGTSLLEKIGEYGVLRSLMTDDSYFYSLIVRPEIMRYTSLTVGESAILHSQNGIVIYPERQHNQAQYHKDFSKDFIASKLLCVTSFIVIDDFNEKTGGTWVIPGSHKFEEMPSQSFIKKNQVQIKAKAGSVIFFDSNLWHKSGHNFSGKLRRAINQLYTRPFIKQQINYPELLKSKIDKESKLAQVLGFWSVTPRSVDEYRVSDPSLRTYRAGQG